MDSEEFIDAVIAHLKADLPPRILALNAEKDDAITLKVPDDAAYSTGADPVLRYPWVEVALPDFRLDDFSVGQVGARYMPTVIVRGWISEPQPPAERADRHIKRFGRALHESLVQPDAFGQHERVVEVTGAYRVNPEFDERDGPIAAVVLRYTIDSQSIRL